MMIPELFGSKGGAQGSLIGRLLRRALRKLSRAGGDRNPGETELGRLSGLPSCCFAHVADKRK